MDFGGKTYEQGGIGAWINFVAITSPNPYFDAAF